MSEAAEKGQGPVAAVVEEPLEASNETPEAAEQPKSQAEKNRENLKAVGAIHGTAVVAALIYLSPACLRRSKHASDPDVGLPRAQAPRL